MTSMVGIIDWRLSLGLAVRRARWILLHGLAIPRRLGAACDLRLPPSTGVRSTLPTRVSLPGNWRGRCKAFARCRRTGAAADTDRAGRGRERAREESKQTTGSARQQMVLARRS